MTEPNERPAPDGGAPALDAYDAIVYDLDGTLVELAVDWAEVADRVLDVYAEHAIIPPTDDLWGLLEAAEEYGVGEPVEEAIALHERSGAQESLLLPLGERLVAASNREETDGGTSEPTAADGAVDGPISVGVCSLNCEDACRIAVETHGLGAAIDADAIVGRDTVETHKPEPESLLAAIDRLGADPDRTLFVGDSERDAVTAERAGVDYAWVSALLAETV